MGLLDGMRFSQGVIGQGQDMLALTEGRRKQSGLAALMGDYASGGAPDMRGIAENGGNPLAVRNDMQAQDDRGMEETAKYAQMFLALPPGQKQQAYPGLVARVNSLKMDHPPIPNEYDPQFDAGIAQFAQALSGGGGSDTGGNIQSTFVGADGMRYGVTRDGRTMPLGQNAPNNQIIDTGNGFYGVNKGNLSAAPVMVGQGPQSAPAAPQAPQAGTYQTPQGIVRLSDDLSPEQREAAMQDMASGGGQSQVTLPPRNVAPQQFGAGQQLRSAQKPQAAQAPSELQRRVAMAQQMGATPEEIKRLVVGGGQSGNAQAQKTGQGNRIKMAQLDTVQRQIDRLDKAAQSVAGNKVFPAGQSRAVGCRE